MENKKIVQLPRYKINLPKRQAIDAMNDYINGHLSEFIDGEEITIRYLDNDGVSLCSVNAIVDISSDNSHGSVSVELGEYDTIKISNSENPPEHDTLWLTEWGDEEVEVSDLKSEIKLLKLQLKKMQEMLNKHDYALSNTIAGGDIITNSEKYDLENKYDTEQPEDSEYEPSYDTGDTEVDSWDIYLGNSSFKKLIEDDYEFYIRMKYFLKLRLFNKDEKEIDPSGYTLDLKCISLVAGIQDNVLYGTGEGAVAITVTLLKDEELIGQKFYNISLKKNAKPDYETYGEPNVHHILVKTVQTYQELIDNFNYLCVNEFCWCIENSSLYLKIKLPNGRIVPFKINGEGGDIPTGQTTNIVYSFNDEGFITMDDENKGYLFVDDEGYINILAGSIDEEGYIILNDTSPNN